MFRKALLATASISALVCAQPVLADDAASSAGSVQVETVVVTAEKRLENLQDVPVAVSVISGDTLQHQNITNIDSLKLAVPSFESTPFGTAVRGVGTATFSNSIEPSVSTVIDGVVYGRPEMGLGSFYDISQVEVLRGPQGMLFGKNASSGLLNITTNAPNLDGYQFIANASYGEGGYGQYDATANVPLSDTLALRIGGYDNQLGGVLHNTVDSRHFNGNDEWGTRGKLLWEPTADLTITIIADYEHQNAAVTWSPYKDAPGGLMATLHAACGVTASPDDTAVCIDGTVFKHRDNYGISGQIDWKVGDLTLTSITAYRRDIDLSNGDSDSLPINILNTNTANQDTNEFTQELRVTSPAGETFEYVAGVYYFNLKDTQDSDQAGTFGLPLPPGFQADTAIDSSSRTESVAVFAQGTYHILDGWRLIAGGRYTHDRVSLHFDQFTQPGLFLPVQPSVLIDDSVTADNFSWRLGTQYDISDRVMAYFTAARGYKGPGFNQTGITSPSISQAARPEIPMDYELGLKGAFLDNRLVLDVALFDETFHDYQAQIVDESITPAVFRTTNAGALKTNGVELDATAVPIEGLFLNAGLAYLNTEYSDFGGVSCYPGQPIGTGAHDCQVVFDPVPHLPVGTAVNVSGLSLSGAPRWIYNLVARYEHALTEGVNGYISGNYSWRSAINFSSNGDPNTLMPALGILGAELGVESEDGRWHASIWAKNLLDQRYPGILFGTPFGGAGDYSQVFTQDSFRRVGATVGLRF